MDSALTIACVVVLGLIAAGLLLVVVELAVKLFFPRGPKPPIRDEDREGE